MNSSHGSKSRGMVFGVFDGLHPGHEFFLSMAAERCKELIVVVTLPEAAFLLKKRLPSQTFDERVSRIKEFNPRFIVVPGDEKPGEWNVLKANLPDIVFLGYDQEGIARELDQLDVPYMFLGSYQPDKHKSSLNQGITKTDEML